MPPRIPALVQVLLAVATLVLVVASFVFSDNRQVVTVGREVVGVEEVVRLTGPEGKTVEVAARIDTGASTSSLDTDLAEDLGYDLDEADTVTVASALGDDERPVIGVALQIAGEVIPARMTVTDRTERSNLVLLGRDDLGPFQVSVRDRLLTTPQAPEAPRALQLVLQSTPALGPGELLAMLPLAALLIVVLRVVVGLTTLGTFSPILLALGYTQSGIVLGVGLTVALFALGFASQPLLRRFRLPRVARLAVLVGLVTVGLLSVQQIAGFGDTGESWGAALPVVVTATIIERLWESWDTDGAKTAAVEAVTTLAVALLATLLLLSPLIRQLAETVPVPLALTCSVWAFVAGTYRGLRLLELRRFRRLASRPAVQA